MFVVKVLTSVCSNYVSDYRLNTVGFNHFYTVNRHKAR